MATFEIEGIPQLRAALARAGERAPIAMASALLIEAESIMHESRSLVPVDTGALRASGTVGHPEITMTGASVEFGYGGAASDYAVVQHERMDFHHPHGEAKFLERPTLEHAHGMGQRMAVTIKRFLERR